MKKSALILTIVFLITLPLPAHSQVSKIAQTGLQFLKVDVSPRAAAMGGAYMMIGADASAMFYNPAGIANIPSDGNLDLFVGRTEWIADIAYSSVAAAKNFGNIGVFGVSATFADYGDIHGTRVAATASGFEETGLLDVGAYAVGLTYARKLSDKFTVGGQVKLVNQNLGSNAVQIAGGDPTNRENDVTGVGYDFGTIFYPGFRSFRFGMSVRNLSAELEYEKEGFQLPLTFTIGVAIDLMDFIGTENQSLLLAIDAIHPRDFEERLNVGAEYLLMDMFALRAGYKFNYDEEGVTAGLGFQQQLSGVKLKLDYAYADFGVFDTVNRFSVGFSF